MKKIFLVMDNSCNNACNLCAKKTEEQGSLSLDQIIEKLNLAEPTEEDFIEISGGEPTLRGDLIDLCRYVKSTFKTKIVILSNGRKFKNMEFCEALKEAGIDRVVTAFYGPNTESHESISQRKGSFSETFQGLKNLQEIGMPISVKTVAVKQNYPLLAEFVRFAYDEFPSAWVSIHGLIMRGQAYINREKIVARYRDMKPFIEEAFDEAIKREKNLGLFIIPSCIIDPCYWGFLGKDWKQISREMVYISPESTFFGNPDIAQPEYCSDCMVSKDCSWAWESAWKEYIRIFGTEELNKITPSQIRYK